MENYKINKSLGFVRLPFSLTSDFDDSMKELRKQRIVDDALNTEIGQINDYEITAFRPNFTTLTFDIFFHHSVEMQNVDYCFSNTRAENLLMPMGSVIYEAQTPDVFALVSADGVVLDSDVIKDGTGAWSHRSGAIYTSTTENADIRTMLSDAYTNYYDQMNSYFVAKGITKYPSFWNSFGYPFYTQKESWYVPNSDGTPSTILLPKRFDPQPYLYNSFIKMNVYTSPYAVSQELLFQNVVYVNPRWCLLEGDAGGSWHRPTFNLNETTDGYYLYWLNNYNIDTFYVSFQFWDALNGKMINLMPSHIAEIDKHWVQSVNIGTVQEFDARMMYLEYKISYANKKYTIGGFDANTRKWNLHPNPIRLYELVFDTTDDNFAVINPNIEVANGVAAATSTGATITSDFDILLNAYVRDLTPSILSEPVIFEEGINFQSIRTAWQSEYANTPDRYASTIKITNNSAVPIYLKNVEIELTDQGESRKQLRLAGARKDFSYPDNTLNSVYILSSVPTPNISLDNGLQNGFAVHYDPSRNTWVTGATNGHYGGTVAVSGVDDNKPEWWTSAAWKGWFYPINSTNLFSHGERFAERLFISHKGDDLSDIPPNGELILNLSWGFGEDYGYTNIEPYFYPMCSSARSMQGVDYTVDLTYRVKLYFNDLAGTLPVNSNTVEFVVSSYYLFKYISNASLPKGSGTHWHPIGG